MNECFFFRLTMASKSDKNSGNSDKELALKAKSEFNKGNYANCVQILEKLAADKNGDLKLAHNRSVAEFYKGGLKKTESFQKALKTIFEKVCFNVFFFVFFFCFVLLATESITISLSLITILNLTLAHPV